MGIWEKTEERWLDVNSALFLVCACAVSVPGFVSFLSVCLCVCLSLLGSQGPLAPWPAWLWALRGWADASPFGPCLSSARAGVKLFIDSI